MVEVARGEYVFRAKRDRCLIETSPLAFRCQGASPAEVSADHRKARQDDWRAFLVFLSRESAERAAMVIEERERRFV